MVCKRPLKPNQELTELVESIRVHQKCAEKACANFVMSPEEIQLFESILEKDYLEQERWAEQMGETREEMLVHIPKMIEEHKKKAWLQSIGKKRRQRMLKRF